MSVPAYERKESKMEFITQACNLVVSVGSICRRLSKAHTFYGVKQAFDCTLDVYLLCIQGNALDLKLFARERLLKFEEALGKLQFVDAFGEILHGYAKVDKEGSKKIDNNRFVNLGKQISEVRKLLTGVIKREKDLLGV